MAQASITVEIKLTETTVFENLCRQLARVTEELDLSQQEVERLTAELESRPV